MIFVESKSDSDILEKSIFLCREEFKCPLISLWYYPEASDSDKNKLENVFEDYFTEEKIVEMVTTYDDVDKCQSKLYKCSDNFIVTLMNNIEFICHTCDSISLYDENSIDWVFCYIFHENMGIFKDDTYSEILNDYNLPHRLQAPENW